MSTLAWECPDSKTSCEITNDIGDDPVEIEDMIFAPYEGSLIVSPDETVGYYLMCGSGVGTEEDRTEIEVGAPVILETLIDAFWNLF